VRRAITAISSKWRRYPGDIFLLGCAAVPEVSDLVCAHGRDGARTWSPHHLQHLALGPNLCSRTGQALPPAPEANDETYIRIGVRGRFIYPAVESTGQIIYFLLTSKRDAQASKTFFRKALFSSANPQPRVINVDKNRAYPTAVKELNVEGTLRAPFPRTSANT